MKITFKRIISNHLKKELKNIQTDKVRIFIFGSQNLILDICELPKSSVILNNGLINQFLWDRIFSHTWYAIDVYPVN